MSLTFFRLFKMVKVEILYWRDVDKVWYINVKYKFFGEREYEYEIFGDRDKDGVRKRGEKERERECIKFC